jgi:penicillin-binding protein 1C
MLRRSAAGFFLLIFLPAVLIWCLDKVFPVRLDHRPMATVVTASDGTPLRAFADPSGTWRYPVTPDQVSPLYLQALLTYEDRWFYYHPGVNPFAMIRACFQNLAAGRIMSGGSTLTMQVARILFSAPDADVWTAKFWQLFRAFQLEMHFSKKEILGLYLTHAPFGANIEGIWAASQTWLARDPMDLTHAEAALLAVLPQAPGFVPARPPQRPGQAGQRQGAGPHGLLWGLVRRPGTGGQTGTGGSLALPGPHDSAAGRPQADPGTSRPGRDPYLFGV